MASRNTMGCFILRGALTDQNTHHMFAFDSASASTKSKQPRYARRCPRQGDVLPGSTNEKVLHLTRGQHEHSDPSIAHAFFCCTFFPFGSIVRPLHKARRPVHALREDVNPPSTACCRDTPDPPAYCRGTTPNADGICWSAGWAWPTACFRKWSALAALLSQTSRESGAVWASYR